ncbi:hypothetical protein PIROE2DRAFT_5902 [Piromyces sp. E2]|nr:hypothetical protein PIROE2DRAFT_5902 [Piromyces sp. E2]|eukprot:OUM66803.1 hypothetical protein PIROE2DRAFT_5902 [Piromyces sp. E2]
MANETNIISKLTKGLKLKINKKKKNNWKTLNSNDSLPATPVEEEYMLFSDTEAELYKAKANVEANRSFSFNNTNNTTNHNDNNMSTKNILGSINNTSNFIGRSKTYNNRTTTYNTYNVNNRSIYGTSPSNKYLYTPNATTESRKNSFQTICSPQNVNSTQPITIKYTSPSNNTTPYSSVPNSPISIESSDTYVNEMKANSNNPFIRKNSASNAKPKSNNFLSVSTANMDPALSHSLISPIEFDGSGKEIKKSSSTTTTTNVNVTVTPEQNTASSNQNKPSEPQPIRSKSIKRVKPLITFDTPPVVSPITAETDSDDYIRGRKRSSKKHKKYSKKRSSNLTLKTSELKELAKNKFSSEPTSVIAARAHSKLNSPQSSSNEEDDDVPLGIIQYKCISSILKETGPTNISSLQSNTKKSHKSKNNYGYGYMSPPREVYLEKYDFPKFNNYTSYYQENYVI